MKAHESKRQSEENQARLDKQQKARIKLVITKAITKGYTRTHIHETISPSNILWLKEMNYVIDKRGGRLGEDSYAIYWRNAEEPNTDDI